MNRSQLLTALRSLLAALEIRPDELRGSGAVPPLREPKRSRRGLENLKRGATVTAKAQAQARGHDMSRFYGLGDGRARATCYTCDAEALIVFEEDGSLLTSGSALDSDCAD